MKNAIIIGATSGIGREVAIQLALKGYKVGITGRRKKLLEQLQQSNPQAFATCCFDATAEDAIDALNSLSQSLGSIDLILLSSGTGEINKSLDFALEEKTINLNVKAFTRICDWAYNLFVQQGEGHLAAISSIGGLRGTAEAPAYTASKAYQINYLEGLAQKAHKTNIAITDIRPGLVDTAMAKGEGLFWIMPLPKIGKQILHGLLKKQQVIYVTKRWRLIASALKRIPRWLYMKIGN